MRAALLLLVASRALAAEPEIVAVPAPAVAWRPAPGMAGVEIAPVFGDPKAGPFMILMRMAKGTTIQPHWHTASEILTVLSGEAVVGGGDRIDAARGTVLGPGGYAVIPGKAKHWGLARTDVVAVRYADGPADITFVP